MLFHRSVCFVLLSVIQLESIVGVTPSCKKNRFIDYSQVVETECIVEACIHYANCTLTETERCPCKRDFVVRYNVTTEHEDDDDDEHDDEDIIEGVTTHLGVITQHPDDEDMIVVRDKYDSGSFSISLTILPRWRSEKFIHVSTMNAMWQRSSGKGQILYCTMFYWLLV